MKNTIIHLIAKPGTGKLTVAKEIMQKLQDHDVTLIDNHAINNLVFQLVNPDGKSKLPENIWTYVREIKNSVLNAMSDIALPNKSFVFTNALFHEDEVDYKNFYKLIETAEKRNARFVPVRLHLSDLEEHKKRISSPDRSIKMKETNPEAPLRYQDKELIRIDHPNLLDIETSGTTAKELADKIIAHALAV